MQKYFTPSFNFITPAYDKLAKLVFGKAVEQAQLYLVNKIPQESDILIIGGGSGWYIHELLNRKIGRKIVYLEASEKMLALSRKMVLHHPDVSKVEFRLGDEMAVLPNEKFAVLITNFFLDLFAPMPFARITTILYNSLIYDGYWLVTDFVQPSGNIYKKLAGRFLLKAMYIFFRIVAGISAKKLPDWEKSLQEINLISGESSYFYHGLIKATYFRKINIQQT